jgi:hypothetical protein
LPLRLVLRKRQFAIPRPPKGLLHLLPPFLLLLFIYFIFILSYFYAFVFYSTPSPGKLALDLRQPHASVIPLASTSIAPSKFQA